MSQLIEHDSVSRTPIATIVTGFFFFLNHQCRNECQLSKYSNYTKFISDHNWIKLEINTRKIYVKFTNIC